MKYTYDHSSLHIINHSELGCANQLSYRLGALLCTCQVQLSNQSEAGFEVGVHRACPGSVFFPGDLSI